MKKNKQKKKNKRKKWLVRIIVGVLGIILLTLLFEVWNINYYYSKNILFNADSIKIYKDRVYKIYNEGLVGWYSGYDSITIESPDDDDKKIVFNEGLSNVNYPDLMKLELKYGNRITEYDGNTFKVYFEDGLCYLEITVDKEHTDVISDYAYKEKINYAQVLKDARKKVCISFILYCLVIAYFGVEEHYENCIRTKNNEE